MEMRPSGGFDSDALRIARGAVGPLAGVTPPSNGITHPESRLSHHGGESNKPAIVAVLYPFVDVTGAKQTSPQGRDFRFDPARTSGLISI